MRINKEDRAGLECLLRQFAMVDEPWFDQSPYAKLRGWLQALKAGFLFSHTMIKIRPWSEGDPTLHVGSRRSEADRAVTQATPD